MKGGLSGVIGCVDGDMLLQQHFHSLKHLGLGGVFVGKRSQASTKAGGQHEGGRMVSLLA